MWKFYSAHKCGTADKIKAIKQQNIPDIDDEQSSWARGYLSNKFLLCIFLEKDDIAALFQLRCWRKQIYNICAGCEECALSMKKRRAKEGTERGGGREGREEDCCNQG